LEPASIIKDPSFGRLRHRMTATEPTRAITAKASASLPALRLAGQGGAADNMKNLGAQLEFVNSRRSECRFNLLIFRVFNAADQAANRAAPPTVRPRPQQRRSRHWRCCRARQRQPAMTPKHITKRWTTAENTFPHLRKRNARATQGPRLEDLTSRSSKAARRLGFAGDPLSCKRSRGMKNDGPTSTSTLAEASAAPASAPRSPRFNGLSNSTSLADQAVRDRFLDLSMRYLFYAQLSIGQFGRIEIDCPDRIPDPDQRQRRRVRVR
jgi:hypothetical protein